MLRKEQVLRGTINEIYEYITTEYHVQNTVAYGKESLRKQLEELKFIPALDDSVCFGIVFFMEEIEIKRGGPDFIPEVSFQLVKVNVVIENQ